MDLGTILIYAIIACVLFVIFYREEKTEAMDEVHSDYAGYRLEMMLGEDYES